MSRKVNVAPCLRDFPIGFDPHVDMQEVEQVGFVNLCEAFDKGIIPFGGSFNEEVFNGCSAPGTLISRSQDVFDGLRKREYVRMQLSKLSAEERARAEQAMQRQAENEGRANVDVTPEE